VAEREGRELLPRPWRKATSWRIRASENRLKQEIITGHALKTIGSRSAVAQRSRQSAST
jgi:hypothetical protein